MMTAPPHVQIEVQKLQDFHKNHFPNQSVPVITTTANELPHTEGDLKGVAGDELGHYDDGVRRTLSDDQIAMFRNSEIQRLLAQRRRQREQEADEQAQIQERQEVNSREENHRTVQHEKKPRFADDLTEEVQSLVYDDRPLIAEGQTGKFMWPKLG